MRSPASMGTIGLALLPVPASANTPPPVPFQGYYGPVRYCGDGVAMEARAGEGLTVSGDLDAYINIGRHMIGVSRRPNGYAALDPALVRPMGSLARGDGVTFARYRVTAGQPHDGRVTYLYDPGGGAGWRIEIASALFDGSVRDRAPLARVMLGEAARAACAAVPPALRPTPERVNLDVLLMRPGRHPGPLTICWAGMAFDVRAGEAAVLPWNLETHRFAVVAPALTFGVTGDFRSRQNPAGGVDAAVAGPLLGFPTIYGVVAGSRNTGVVFDYLPAGVAATNRARLVAVADVKALGPDPGPGLQFTFSRPLTDTERDAVIGRVRAQAPSDHCFDPDRT